MSERDDSHEAVGSVPFVAELFARPRRHANSKMDREDEDAYGKGEDENSKPRYTGPPISEFRRGSLGSPDRTYKLESRQEAREAFSKGHGRRYSMPSMEELPGAYRALMFKNTEIEAHVQSVEQSNSELAMRNEKLTEDLATSQRHATVMRHDTEKTTAQMVECGKRVEFLEEENQRCKASHEKLTSELKRAESALERLSALNNQLMIELDQNFDKKPDSAESEPVPSDSTPEELQIHSTIDHAECNLRLKVKEEEISRLLAELEQIYSEMLDMQTSQAEEEQYLFEHDKSSSGFDALDPADGDESNESTRTGSTSTTNPSSDENVSEHGMQRLSDELDEDMNDSDALFDGQLDDHIGIAYDLPPQSHYLADIPPPFHAKSSDESDEASHTRLDHVYPAGAVVLTTDIAGPNVPSASALKVAGQTQTNIEDVGLEAAKQSHDDADHVSDSQEIAGTDFSSKQLERGANRTMEVLQNEALELETQGITQRTSDEGAFTPRLDSQEEDTSLQPHDSSDSAPSASSDPSNSGGIATCQIAHQSAAATSNGFRHDLGSTRSTPATVGMSELLRRRLQDERESSKRSRRTYTLPTPRTSNLGTRLGELSRQAPTRHLTMPTDRRFHERTFSTSHDRPYLRLRGDLPAFAAESDLRTPRFQMLSPRTESKFDFFAPTKELNVIQRDHPRRKSWTDMQLAYFGLEGLQTVRIPKILSSPAPILETIHRVHVIVVTQLHRRSIFDLLCIVLIWILVRYRGHLQQQIFWNHSNELRRRAVLAWRDEHWEVEWLNKVSFGMEQLLGVDRSAFG